MVRRSETAEGAPHRATRILDPFSVMRSTRLLAPHDPELNDIRWLTGESLRRVYGRAMLDQLKAADPSRVSAGVSSGLPMSEVAMYAREKLRAAEERAGPHSWPILVRIIIEGAGVRDCRRYVPEIVTPWRADAVVADRLRVALDAIGPILGVTERLEYFRDQVQR